jgi:hypothetical protein
MPVTHTQRQVVPLFPRLHIMAMSMERLQIGRARIAAIPIDMIHLNLVVMLEEQPAVATAPVLRFQQLGPVADWHPDAVPVEYSSTPNPHRKGCGSL